MEQQLGVYVRRKKGEKMSTIKTSLITSILVLVIFSFPVLAFPGIPHQFFGSVAINGAPAHDGKVIVAKIQGVEVGAAIAKNGRYGFDPIFYIEDPNSNRNGKTIEFFVDGVRTASATFENGKSTKLDFSITRQVQNGPKTNEKEKFPVDNKSPTSGGSQQSGVCVENWKCTDWFDCFNGEQERLCIDENECETDRQKPAEKRECISVSNPSCVEDWECGEWGPCDSGLQARWCEDKQGCSTENNKPQTERMCDGIEAAAQKPQFTGLVTQYSLSTILGMISLLLIVAIIALSRKRGAQAFKTFQ